MANLVITSTTNGIKIVTNDSSTELGFTYMAIRFDQISSIYINDNGVELRNKDVDLWMCTVEQNGTQIVDTIDGVAPSSRQDVYDKLTALIV